MTIYKSCSPKYTNDQIKHLTVTKSFVSYERLLSQSLYYAIGKRDNEVMVGMQITSDGIYVLLESKEIADQR